MMGTLQMSVSRAGRVRVVAAAGCLDVNTRGWLADFVEGVLDAAAEIVVDLSEVRLCDAASMATLVRIAERCAGHGGWLRLAAPAAPEAAPMRKRPRRSLSGPSGRNPRGCTMCAARSMSSARSRRVKR